jgi:ACS family hexuronate transporter-like MFS transporter
MAGTCGNAGLMIFTLLVGSKVAAIGYTPFFVGLAALDLVGAMVLWWLVRENKTPAVA